MLWRKKSAWDKQVIWLIGVVGLLAYLYTQRLTVAQTQPTTKPATQPSTKAAISEAATQNLWRAALEPTTPEDGQWTMPGKDYASTRFSGLAQITPGNAKRLRPMWSFSTGVLGGHEDPGAQMIRWVLMIVFAACDLAVVFLKVFGPAGP